MDRFFDWLAKPMSQEDVTSWYLANNITPELTELFRDFCISLLELLKETYLGDDDIETKVGMTEKQKKEQEHKPAPHPIISQAPREVKPYLYPRCRTNGGCGPHFPRYNIS